MKIGERRAVPIEKVSAVVCSFQRVIAIEAVTEQLLDACSERHTGSVQFEVFEAHDEGLGVAVPTVYAVWRVLMAVAAGLFEILKPCIARRC